MRTFPRESPGNENPPRCQPATRTFTRASPSDEILSESIIRKVETPYVSCDETPSIAPTPPPSLRIEKTVQRSIPTPNARHENTPPSTIEPQQPSHRFNGTAISGSRKTQNKMPSTFLHQQITDVMTFSKGKVVGAGRERFSPSSSPLSSPFPWY